MADDEQKELARMLNGGGWLPPKFEELRRKDLRNVNVAEHIEAMNGAFEAALSTQTRTTSGLVEQQAIFAKIRKARSVPPDKWKGRR